MSDFDKDRSLFYNEIGSVPATIQTSIINEVSPSILFVSQIMCSGDVYAKFSISRNNKKLATKRSGPSRNVDFIFRSNLTIKQGDIFKVDVIHFRSDQTPSFECGVFGYN